MTPESWSEFIVWAIFYFALIAFNSWFAVRQYKRRQKRKDVKVMKALLVRAPDHQILKFITVESSNEDALADIQEQIEEAGL